MLAKIYALLFKHINKRFIRWESALPSKYVDSALYSTPVTANTSSLIATLEQGIKALK